MIQETKLNLIYRKNPQWVLGFHGCDQSVVDNIIVSSTQHLEPSKNDYDWLGDGIYFWQGDQQRAYEWALEKQKRNPKKIKKPAVIGAIIDLGLCLNLSDRQSICLLQHAYTSLKLLSETAGYKLQENSTPDSGGFNLIRPLDCAVIKHAHTLMEKENIKFDSVVGYFQEGEDAFPGSGMKAKSHIQICVRNSNCIKGYFLPRS